jgi:glycosyltransferase involved in cell wall biosynthesis
MLKALANSQPFKVVEKPQGLLGVHFPGWEKSKTTNDYGYGTVAQNLLVGSENLEITKTFSNQEIALVYNPVCDINGRSILAKYSNSFYWTKKPKIFAYTMFENTKLPTSWVANLNEHADVVIVPSNWQKKMFITNKVTKPIEILPHGVETHFTYFERPEIIDGKFTFIHYNAGEHRKGFMETIDAFCNEFRKGENVKLILKTNSRERAAVCYLYLQKKYVKGEVKNEIQILDKAFSKTEMNELLHTCHCLVFPSKGEGFGLTPYEAAATGLPCIVTYGHAFLDHWNEAFLGVDYTMQPSNYGWEFFQGGYLGKWHVPNVKTIESQMRYAKENWTEVQKQAKIGSEYIRQKLTWENSLFTLAKIIRKHI